MHIFPRLWAGLNFWWANRHRQTRDPFVAVAGRLNTKKAVGEGKKEGAPELAPNPASHAPEYLSSLRGEYRRRLEQGVRKCQDELIEIENECDELQSRLEAEHLLEQADGIVASVQDSQKIHARERAIASHKDEFAKRRNDFLRFQKEHGLSYRPQTGHHLVWGLLIAAFLLATEAGVNFVMFAVDFSLGETVAMVIGIPMVNVVFGFVVGRLMLPQAKFHGKTFRGVLSYLGIIFVFMPAVLYFNSLLAVFRSVGTTAIYADNRLQKVLVAPFTEWDRIEITGVLLFVFGLVWAMIAVLDGYFADDPFPGYGAKYRACEREKRLVAKQFAACHRHLERQALRAQRRLSSLFEDAKLAIRHWSTNVNLVERRFVDYRAMVTNMEREYKQAWDNYWQAYASAYADRSGEQAESIVRSKEKHMLLFDGEGERDSEHVFSDVKRLYMNDGQRQKQVDAYRKIVAEQNAASSEKLRKVVQEQKHRLRKLEQESACNI